VRAVSVDHGAEPPTEPSVAGQALL